MTAERVMTTIDTIEEAVRLLGADGAELERLLDRAAQMRDAGLQDAGRPGVITYSRKVFVPLTTLCRDRCHYCIFVDTPGQLLTKRAPMYMSDEQVLQVVRAGAAHGCKEALLTLGDRPEDRWPQARAWLDDHGFASTLEYVGHVARLITRETGLLAHLNPGVMSADELRALRPTAPSMGMMLETTSRELYETPGSVHYGSPDKDPAVRLQVIADAGVAGIPFTTGILVGIGETLRDRAESLFALRDLHAQHGQIQEVIVQNFRAKHATAMRGAADASLREHIAAVAVARLIMGPQMRIQAPPNLADAEAFDLLVRAGIDDWGGVSPVTADHVNPERPWPDLDDLAALTAASGFTLRERLTAHSEYVQDPQRWFDPAIRASVAALADPATGLARADAGATTPLDPAQGHRTNGGITGLVGRALEDPTALDDAEWVTLLTASGADLEAVVAAADDLRRFTVGETVSMVVNRNLASTGLREEPTGEPGTFDLADAAAVARDAWELGATELCIQGMIPAHLDPANYLDLVRAVKDAAPGLHLHAYRPQDVVDFADRSGISVPAAFQALRAAGVDTVPGTGVKVLSERVRQLVAPGDLEIDRWVDTIEAAHDAGFRSTSVLFYGHVETAAERIAHLRMLRVLQDRRQGFTEFVPIPLPGFGVPLVSERAPVDEHRAMVAVSRLLLAGSIRHIQIPWTRHGRDLAIMLLRAGGDDLGGTLLDGRVLPEAGAESGLEFPFAEAERAVGRIFRSLRRRTTDYREPVALEVRA